MIKKRILVLLITTILLMQFTLGQTVQSNAIFNGISSKNSILGIDPLNNIITPDAPPGTEVVKSNLIRDGQCEEVQSYDRPSGFYSGGSAYTVANFSYQNEVHTGSYGAYLSARGTEQFAGNLDENRYLTTITERAYLDEDIEMDFWFNAKANPDIAQSASIRVYLRLSTNLGTYYLRYIISQQTITDNNNSNNAYYDIRAPLNTWTHFTRNITEDLVKAVLDVPDVSQSFINRFNMICFSPVNPTGDAILLLDDVSITNKTIFEYFSDNGDFEDGDSSSWVDDATGPGFCYLTTTDKTQGNSAMNITAYSPYDYTRAYVQVEQSTYQGWTTHPKGYVPQQTGDFVFNFDWKYSDMENGLGSQSAYFYMYFLNETYSSGLYYYLGDESDVVPNYNSTSSTSSYYYFAADGFGTRDVWNTFTLDLYDTLTALNISNLPIYYLGIYTLADNADDLTVQLLIDDFQMITYPTCDPGFETYLGFNSNDPIALWLTTMDDDYVNITSDAHSGNFAANLSAYNGVGHRYAYRNTFLPITNNLFTDFWWRLDKITPALGGQAYSYIRLRLDTNNYLYYIFGSNTFYFGNSSNTCYYYVDEINQTGTWNNLFRNITNDAIDHFGDEVHNITEIRLGAYAAAGSAEIVTIFDDLHFATDVTGPTLDDLATTTPLYGEPVTIFIVAEDNIALDRVELHYSIDSGSWMSIPMTYYGGQFDADIPAQDYDTLVEYYIEAKDIYGHETTLGTEISPYSYTVLDLINPVLTVEAPLESETLAGNILINVTDAYDLGSGIDTFDIKIDNEVVFDDTIFPSVFVWDTNDYTNDNHTLLFTIKDIAGNTVELGFVYDIYNPPTNWEAFTAFMQQWGPYIGGGAGGLAIVVVVLVVVLRRKKGI